MSNTAQEQETPTAPKQGRAKLVIALTIGLIAGAGAGSLVVGPLLAESKGGGDHGKPAEGAELEAQCSALFEEWSGEKRPPAPAVVYTLESLVLNPANSGGTRYLMASVGFGLRDLHGEEQMTLRDAEIRDIVIRILGSKTIPELADTSVRTSIKEEIRTEVGNIVGEHALIDVYFPQFVIQ
jgi:flagellar protein FliL